MTIKKQIKEGLLNPAYEVKKAIPTEEDFKTIDDFRYEIQRGKISYREVGSILNDVNKYKIISYLVIANLYKWDLLKDACMKKAVEMGYTYPELGTILNFIKQNKDLFKEFYDKYVVKTAPTSGFFRIVAYDPKYNPPVRRHIYLRKKLPNNVYKVSIGGAAVTDWFEEPFFSTEDQAKDFIKNLHKIKSVNDVTTFKYSITSKPIDLGTWNNVKHQISDLTDCVLVNTQCGPAYMNKRCKYFSEDLKENISDLEENIEKHEELNPILFEDNKIKSEIREKCLEIVDVFLEDFKENNIELEIKDIIITGSNASYNYTKDSDIDIHIVADTSNLEDPNKLYPLIYDAYKSLFNKRLDIKFYDIPVEVYVETQETPLVSNGVYSIKNDEWIKEPEADTIPEVDQSEIDKAVTPWENRYKMLIKKINSEKDTDDTEIEKYITELYKLRHNGLAEGGEYSIGNLVFKEIRNKGYLDNLKDLKNKVIANNLSILESYKKKLTNKEINDYRIEISKITNYPVLIQENGMFEISNVKESDFSFTKDILNRQNYIEYVQKSAEKLDFSRMSYQGIPNKRYKLIGKIRV